jgi:hypothetical protein
MSPVTPQRARKAAAAPEWPAATVLSAFASAPALATLDGAHQGRSARKDSVNPWVEEEDGVDGEGGSAEGTPRSAKRGRGEHGALGMRGVQRGGSAAMDVLRACSFDVSLGACPLLSCHPSCIHVPCTPQCCSAILHGALRTEATSNPFHMASVSACTDCLPALRS